ncbi:MAG TPA: helix-turn-helix domain-containing protein [Bacilli bacterium]
MNNMISPDQAAKLLGLSVRTIQSWLRLGKLNGIKLGSVWRIQLDEINRLLLSGGVPSPKLSRIPEPLLSLQLIDGRSVTFVESAEGLLLVAVNGKPKATIKPNELPAMIRAIVKSSGSTQVSALLFGE